MNRFQFIKCNYTNNLYLWDVQESRGYWVTPNAIRSYPDKHSDFEPPREINISIKEAIEYLGWHR